MATAIRNTVTVDQETGEHKLSQEEVEIRRLDSMMESSGLSAAQLRLKKLKEQRGALIQAREIHGETWYLKLLNWPQLCELADTIARNAHGTLDINKDGVKRSLMIACLMHGIATSESDSTPLFTFDLAQDYTDEPAAKELIRDLFDAIVKLNPDILPQQGKKKKSGSSRK
jgi:hypothetical protein